MVTENSLTIEEKLTLPKAPKLYSGIPLSKEDIIASRHYIKQFLHDDIVMEFTRDPGLLHQYYRIRDQEFKMALHCDDYDSLENEHDKTGYIAVARIGNFCIGGVRLNIKSPRRPNLLPVEINGFRLEEHFSYLAHKEVTYAQASGFVILPELRSNEICFNLVKRMFARARSLNVHTMFAASPKINSRLYKMECVQLGIVNTVIHYDIKLPVYADTDYLVSSPVHEMPACEEYENLPQEKEYLH